MRRFPVAVVLLLLCGTGITTGAAPAGGYVEWWGPTGPEEGWHMRVPVTVVNNHDFELTNPVVSAQLDVSDLLREAGWITSAQGDVNVLRSFELSLESFRVVEVTNLQPMQPGSTDGRLRVFDPTKTGDARYEIPRLVLPGLLDQPQAKPFDARTNPVVTVFWEVPGAVAPGGLRFFMVYLDTPLNFQDPTDVLREPGGLEDHPAAARLEALHWSGAGTELVGFVPDGSVDASLTIVGLHPGTEVTVLVERGSGRWQPVTPPAGFSPNPVSMEPNQVMTVYTGGGPTLVRILATKPIVAFGVGAGYVPSVDRGMAGRDFILAKTKPSPIEDDTVHFIGVGDTPTVVNLQPIVPDGRMETYTLNSRSNPYPYTIGHRTGSFNPNNNCVDPGHPNKLLDSPGVFRATVSSGGPILVQHAPADGLVQVPTRSGGPDGTNLLSATGWTDFILFTPQSQPAFCRPTNQVGGWLASGLEGPSAAHVTSPEALGQVDPAADGTTRSVPAAPAVSDRYPAAMLDRPLVFTAQESMVLFTGHLTPRTNPARVPIVHGPLGGADGGMTFVSMGPTVVYAPYPNTQVHAELSYSASGVVERDVNLPQLSSHEFKDISGGDFLEGLRLEASRPIIVYPMRAPPLTLAALPVFPDVVLGEAEFRGHLVEVDSASGLDPLTGSTVIGEPITYRLRVINHGRDIGGAGISDTIDLSLADVPEGWGATLDRVSVPLGGGAGADVHLTLLPGPDVEPGALAAVEVRAASRGNPQMVDTLQTVTYLKRSFDVGLWFEIPNGPKEMARAIGAGATADYSLVVKNRGSVEDAIRLTMTPPPAGWDVLIHEGGVQVDEVQLGPGEVRTLSLTATPPSGAVDGLLISTVTAQSVSSPAALDRVTATAKLRTPSQLGLEVLGERAHIEPGGTAVFDMVVKNLGGGVAELTFGTSRDAVPGWSDPVVYSEEPATGAKLELTRISLAPGDALPLKLAVQAPGSARAGDVLGIRLEARQAQGQDSLEALLYAIVRPVHRLDVVPPPPVVWDEGDASLTLPVRITNRGNDAENLTWRLLDAPLEWLLDAPRQVHVPQNATQSFTMQLSVPARWPAGLYSLAGQFVSDDGNATPFALEVAVGDVAFVRTDVPVTLDAQPGREATALVPVENVGNVPVRVVVGAADDGSWPVQDVGSVVLPPGASTNVRVGWLVPRDAVDGPRQQAARLLLEPLADGGVASEHDVVTTLDVGRADLKWLDVRAYPGPAGLLVDARLQNAGSRAVFDLVVHLVSDDGLVESSTIGSLPAQGEAEIRFLLPHASAASAAVLLDPDDVVVEADERNNVAAVVVDDSRDAPGFAAVWLLAVLALFAGTRIGRR